MTGRRTYFLNDDSQFKDRPVALESGVSFGGNKLIPQSSQEILTWINLVRSVSLDEVELLRLRLEVNPLTSYEFQIIERRAQLKGEEAERSQLWHCGFYDLANMLREVWHSQQVLAANS